MWPRSRRAGLGQSRADLQWGYKGPRLSCAGSSWGHGGGYREVPDQGGRASRGPGHPPGTRAPVGRVSHISVVHSSSPGSAGAPALGLVGTLPRCLCTPSSARGPPGRRNARSGGSQAPPQSPPQAGLCLSPPNPTHLNRATPTPACGRLALPHFPLMTQLGREEAREAGQADWQGPHPGLLQARVFHSMPVCRVQSALTPSAISVQLNTPGAATGAQAPPLKAEHEGTP